MTPKTQCRHPNPHGNDGDDGDGEGSGYIDLQWEVWDTLIHDQNIKSVRVSVTATVNRNRQKLLDVDFIKVDM